METKSYEEFLEVIKQQITPELWLTISEQEKRTFYNDYIKMSQGSKEDVKNEIINRYNRDIGEMNKILKGLLIKASMFFIASVVCICFILNSTLFVAIFCSILFFICSLGFIINARISNQLIRNKRTYKKIKSA